MNKLDFLKVAFSPEHKAYQEKAFFFTDYWDAYTGVFPKNRHPSCSKQMGKTNHIERFNNTLRQRLSRFVRKLLYFSKKIENLTGSLFSFIHYYNTSLKT